MDQKIKILVVDDERDICILLKESLELEGSFEVVATDNPFEVERLCLSYKPDLIILDVVMPKRSGTEIVLSLKKNEVFGKIPIIIMSGLGEMVYIKKKNKWCWLPNRPVVHERGEICQERTSEKAAQAYGVEDYIEKPFDPDTLIEKIKYLKEQQDKRREKESPGKERAEGEV